MGGRKRVMMRKEKLPRRSPTKAFISISFSLSLSHSICQPNSSLIFLFRYVYTHILCDSPFKSRDRRGEPRRLTHSERHKWIRNLNPIVRALVTDATDKVLVDKVFQEVVKIVMRGLRGDGKSGELSGYEKVSMHELNLYSFDEREQDDMMEQEDEIHADMSEDEDDEVEEGLGVGEDVSFDVVAERRDDGGREKGMDREMREREMSEREREHDDKTEASDLEEMKDENEKN